MISYRFIVQDCVQQECCHPWAKDSASDGSHLCTGLRQVNILCGGRESSAAGNFCPVFGGKRRKFVPNSPGRPALVPLRRGLRAWVGRGHAQRRENAVFPAGRRRSAYNRSMPRNKKTGLSGQRMTKKPGEFSNLVHLLGLGDFRLLLYNTNNRNTAGKQRTIHHQFCPKILTVLIRH